MIVDVLLSAVWWMIKSLLVDDAFVSVEFLASLKDAIQALGPIIAAISPLTMLVPFQAYGIVLNFVIAAWVLYWPIRLTRFILEWMRGKGGGH